MFEMRVNLKVYAKILKKKGSQYWVWSVVKNGVNGCRICEKKCVIIIIGR